MTAALAGGVFWLGPVGDLRPLPSPSLGAAPEVAPVWTGGMHRSLTGRPTLDRLGLRRTWVLSWPYLDPDTQGWLSLLHSGLLDGPLWLLDPAVPNRLGVQVATAGAVERAPDGFTTTAGSLAWTPSPVAPSGAARPAGSGALVWTAPDTGGALTTGTAVPLVAGESVTFAATVAATIPITPSVSFLNSAGAVLATITSGATTPGSGGARLSVTATPPASAATVRVDVTAPWAGQVATSAWSLTPGTTSVPWSPGGGAAVVLCESLPATYPVPGSFATTVTLLEV